MSAEPRRDGPRTRRQWIGETGSGLAGIALSWLLARDTRASSIAGVRAPGPHFAPRTKRVIQIFCAGGVSHLDTFDWKEDLARHDGGELVGKGENKGFFGQPGHLMRSAYEFARRGESGQFVSSLLPHIGSIADELCIVRSMVSKSNNHTPASFQMNSGFTLNGFPCMGSWISYGLGSSNEDLPTFVVFPDPRGMPAGGSINWTSGFLPAQHQGVPFASGKNDGAPIRDLETPNDVERAGRDSARAFRDRLDRSAASALGGDDELETRIRSYELAARMQASVPEAIALETESEETRRLYGLDDPRCGAFARNCLLARRLVERGTRFVQLWNGGAFGSPRINWDGHESLKENHDAQAATMDRPVAALIVDLKRRGMLDDTLVLWTTEFGRSPATQGIGSFGRDHHPDAFTCFLAGGGVKAGIAHGETDEIGYFVGRDPVTIYDFHATVLHLLGLDHKRLTWYHNGIAEERSESIDRRDVLLDAMRSVSILRVVLFHTLGRFGDDAILLLSFVLPGMPIVFFVSGALAYGALTKPSRTGPNSESRFFVAQRFWSARLRRLLVPFWIYALCVVPLFLVADARTDHPWHAFDESVAWRWALPLLEPLASPALKGLALHLWFVPPFVWLLFVAPVAVALHARVRFLGAALTFVAACIVETWFPEVSGTLRNTLVFGFAFQVGFLFADGSLARLSISRNIALAIGSFAAGIVWHGRVAEKAILNSVPLAHVLVGLAAVPLWLSLREVVVRGFQAPTLAAASRAVNLRAYTLFLWGPAANEAAWRIARAAPPSLVVPAYFVATALCIVTLARIFGRFEDFARRRPSMK